MNKAIKAILAAAGALVLGGIGEGIGTELLKRAAKDDTNEDVKDEGTTAEEPEVTVEEIPEETTEY